MCGCQPAVSGCGCPAPSAAAVARPHPRASTACPAGPQADKAFLVGLKSAQAEARLADDEAAALVKEAARARVEALFDAAVKVTKQRTRTRDYTGRALPGGRARRPRSVLWHRVLFVRPPRSTSSLPSIPRVFPQRRSCRPTS